MVQPFVRVAHVATIVHCSADDVLIVKNKTIVSFALQVVLNLYFSFVFRLILHDCEELLATLTLFVGEAGTATRISETVFTDVFRVIGLFMFLFEAFFGRMFLRGDLITWECLGYRQSTFPVIRSFLELDSIVFLVFELSWVCDELSFLCFASHVCFVEAKTASIAAKALGVTALWNTVWWNWYSLSQVSILGDTLRGCSPAAYAVSLNHFLFLRLYWGLILPYGSSILIIAIKRCLITFWSKIWRDVTQGRHFADLDCIIVGTISLVVLHVFE